MAAEGQVPGVKVVRQTQVYLGMGDGKTQVALVLVLEGPDGQVPVTFALDPVEAMSVGRSLIETGHTGVQAAAEESELRRVAEQVEREVGRTVDRTTEPQRFQEMTGGPTQVRCPYCFEIGPADQLQAHMDEHARRRSAGEEGL